MKVCYFIAVRNGYEGCIALKTQHGQRLVEFKRRLTETLSSDVQLVTISRPAAYGEYAPYMLVETEEEFERAVKKNMSGEG